jgi:hypothetical protein
MTFGSALRSARFAFVIGTALFSMSANALGPIAGTNCPAISIPPSFLPGFSDGQCRLIEASPGGVATFQVCAQLFSQLHLGLSCLINAERATRGLPLLGSAAPLQTAAHEHAVEAGRLRWWTKGADPHKNPVTGSTILSRIQAQGYCGGNPKIVSEIAYTGASTQAENQVAAPMNAVDWWMNVSTGGHREAILNPDIKEFGIGFVGIVADKDVPTAPLMGAYVIDFGACQ